MENNYPDYLEVSPEAEADVMEPETEIEVSNDVISNYEEEIDDDVKNKIASKTILYNDEIHTFDEVIFQCQKAIGCSAERGEEIAWAIHTKGLEVVYSGDLQKCLRVSNVLEEIYLMTKVEI